MVLIRTNKLTTLKLLEEKRVQQEHRTYLGMSGLGHSCMRYLWFEFRWAFTVSLSARIDRLFQRGHHEEDLIVGALEEIGYKVWGRQDEYVDCFGHCKGHSDGAVTGVIEAPKTDHILEIKTMAAKYFNEMKKLGCKASKPVYYSQAQLYMHKRGFIRCLFIAVNKDNDELYVERIYYDRDHALNLLDKANAIILMEKPIKAPFKSTWYECKWCDANDICHYDGVWNRNCRTCQTVGPEPDGMWKCHRHGIMLTVDQQRVGCVDYKSIKDVL